MFMYVYIDVFDGKDYKKDILSSMVIEIKRLNEENNFQFKDIAILCNTHQNIIEVAEYLTLSSIPIVSNEGLLISRSKKVKAIVSFVKYLYNIEDNIAKASVITYLYSNDLFDDKLHDLNLRIHDNNEFVLLLNKINLFFNIDLSCVIKIIILSFVYFFMNLITCFLLSSSNEEVGSSNITTLLFLRMALISHTNCR